MSSPSPAVRLSPRKMMRGLSDASWRLSGAAAGAASAGARTAGLAVSDGGAPSLQAPATAAKNPRKTKKIARERTDRLYACGSVDVQHDCRRVVGRPCAEGAFHRLLRGV